MCEWIASLVQRHNLAELLKQSTLTHRYGLRVLFDLSRPGGRSDSRRNRQNARVRSSRPHFRGPYAGDPERTLRKPTRYSGANVVYSNETREDDQPTALFQRFRRCNLLNASGRAAQQSVPHFHVHIAPRREGDQLDLGPDSSYDETETDRIYENVRSALSTSDVQ